jgi:CRISPR-associated protein Csd2
MTVPYGLYRAHGFVSPHLGADTAFSEADLALLREALCRMFDHDRSATRGQMNARGLYVFKHASPLGNAPSHRLQRLIKVERTRQVTVRLLSSDEWGRVARRFDWLPGPAP